MINITYDTHINTIYLGKNHVLYRKIRFEKIITKIKSQILLKQMFLYRVTFFIERFGICLILTNLNIATS